MIFVTLATTSFPFARLLKTLDLILIKEKSKEKLIVQDKSSSYKFKYKNVEQFSEISFPKLIKYLSKARIIITHGAPSSIFLAQKYGKNQPIIVPRNSRYQEHINNHQILFCQFLSKKDKKINVIFEKNLKIKLKKFIKNPILQKNKVKIHCSKKLISNLEKFCQKIK